MPSIARQKDWNDDLPASRATAGAYITTPMYRICADRHTLCVVLDCTITRKWNKCKTISKSDYRLETFMEKTRKWVVPKILNIKSKVLRWEIEQASCCKFIGKSHSEENVKIGRRLLKLCLRLEWRVFWLVPCVCAYFYCFRDNKDLLFTFLRRFCPL